MKLLKFLPFTGILLLIQCANEEKINYPHTEKQEVSDVYFGSKVQDPYRWLEDDRSKKTSEWVKAQNIVTENYLSKISSREKLKSRLTELWNYSKQSAPFKKGDLFFCFKNNGLQNQSVLYVMKSLDDAGEILLDPNTLSGDGTVSLNTLSVSNDGKTLAYGTSKAGSDWVEINFMDINSKAKLPDVLKWVKFSGVSWKGNTVYYSRYAAPSGSELSQKNQFHKVYLHTLGTSQAKDELIFEDQNNPNYNFGANVSDDERFLFISTSESTSGEKLMMKDLQATAATFSVISDDFENGYNIVGNISDTIYMMTSNDASNNRLVSFTPKTCDSKSWKTILPQTANKLESVSLFNGKIIANYLVNVTSKLFCYSRSGSLLNEIQLPGICKINALHASHDLDFATYGISQFTAPEQVYRLDATTFESKLIFSPDCDFDSDAYLTKQVFYKSKDGTKIPMFITHKKDLVISEKTPCFVYGYGGFNISIAPEFRIDRTVFLEAGGIYCVPNLRGGGEFGEDWHKAGTKCQKQNVFDDFISACEYLVNNKYTSYDKIAIHGRSNGGLLVGAVMTQRPDICKVAIPAVGVLDMMRFHLFTIGRAWSVDYGNSENKEEFDCLIKYSPLHNVQNVKYPATLILTGDHDDRVVPAHSFKFAATLQEKNTGTKPCLIRIDVNAGHGAGKPTSKQIDEFADMWSFVFENLEIN